MLYTLYKYCDSIYDKLTTPFFLDPSFNVRKGNELYVSYNLMGRSTCNFHTLRNNKQLINNGEHNTNFVQILILSTDKE